ncbi:MAG: amidoligase family protein [Rhodospirillales bacterium]
MTKRHQPPKLTNDAGEPRRIGVEIEFGGLDLKAAADIVQKVFGGTVKLENPHRFVVSDTGIGDFGVELDAQMAQPKSMDSETERQVRKLIGDLSTSFVPTEIVGPPAPLNSLDQFDELVEALRQAGAEGTDDGISYAFGLQLNPEAASLQAHDILATLQAYVLMSPLLRRRIDVDPMRRVLPYVDPFPLAYARKILSDDYAPGIGTLIDDYIADNPTRNRELDMLPLFAHLDEDRVRAKLDDPLIKSRPTYHYRLPDTNFNKPGWGAVEEWNRWVIVEKLAADPKKLKRLAGQFLQRNPEDFKGRLGLALKDWLGEVIE